MKNKELRELSLAELDKKIRDTRDELLQLRLKQQTGQVEKTHELDVLRKDVARMLTLSGENSAEDKQSA